MTDIEGKKPYQESGIIEGDMIVKINESKITTTGDLIECVNSCKGDMLEIEYLRNGEIKEANIEPVKTSKNEYKLGLWVRDRSSGYWNNNIL